MRLRLSICGSRCGTNADDVNVHYIGFAARVTAALAQNTFRKHAEMLQPTKQQTERPQGPDFTSTPPPLPRTMAPMRTNSWEVEAVATSEAAA